MKRDRKTKPPEAEEYKPKKRRRITLAIPSCPGGHLDCIPSDCPKAKTYCPNPNLYEVIRIVDYCVCTYVCPRQIASHCQRKTEEDATGKKRISRMKRGE